MSDDFKVGNTVEMREGLTAHYGLGTVMDVGDMTNSDPDMIGVRWDYYKAYNDQYRQDFHWVRPSHLRLAQPNDEEVAQAISSIMEARHGR